MLKKILAGLGIIIALTGAAAAYLLTYSAPSLPADSVVTRTVTAGKLSRAYMLYAPHSLRPGASALIVYHPSQSSGARVRAMVGSVFERIARGENMVVAYPDGFEGHFNDCRSKASYSARALRIDDIGFTRAMVAQLVAEKKIDSTKVYAFGYSNGGHMALRLAIEAPDLVRGIIAVAANFPAPENLDCAAEHAPASTIVLIEGTADQINPYNGGPVSLFGFGDRGSVLSAPESAEWFARRLGLKEGEPVTIDETSDVWPEYRDWTGAGGRVRLVTIEGGGHTVPQADFRFPRMFGATYRNDSVLESSLKFLTADKR